jgi:hypothetical protein
LFCIDRHQAMTAERGVGRSASMVMRPPWLSSVPTVPREAASRRLLDTAIEALDEVLDGRLRLIRFALLTPWSAVRWGTW